MNQRLLDIRNLSIRFDMDDISFAAVDDISFHINKGEVVGLVGESGCGKSVTALSILRLVPSPPGHIEKGCIEFDGQDLLSVDTDALRQIRGREIGMIFQEASTALSPLQRIGKQMTEALKVHGYRDKAAARQKVLEWLEKVRIPDPAERMYAYPYQLSGGMQQRIMIAMALMLEPKLIIADEPTTALDVTIQAQIFRLIAEMRDARTAILLITHDMGVVWEMCDRVFVMYAANIVEEGPRDRIFETPSHPYTRGLLRSIPKLTGKPERLNAIPGQVPSPENFPSGCHFRDRCPHAFQRCAAEKPELTSLAENHRAACFIARKLNHKKMGKG